MEECHNGSGGGRLYVVGTGPGHLDHMTQAAQTAIQKSDVIVGYRTYLDLIPELLAGKEVMSSEMMKEVDRCGKAIDLAAAGRTVSLVCGGDPGIYAMAGLVYEMVRAHGQAIAVEVVPGIAALNACAARLGAPLMHDFAAISLSDLLTPWPVIEKRLEAAAMADFVIVIYNPRSKKRVEQLTKAREIIMAERGGQTPVGIVTAATRENEKIELTTLEELLSCDVGMQSTVIIGNSQTYLWQDVMVTPRGYARKYEL
ncbi:MAG: precorrin-3B C(17)-methyltransferase [Desulfobulbaceae bacterium]|nr:precorrin-3B C(17)-methyltransferase [Desulfobulbaceae bacterium]